MHGEGFWAETFWPIRFKNQKKLSYKYQHRVLLINNPCRKSNSKTCHWMKRRHTETEIRKIKLGRSTKQNWKELELNWLVYLWGRPGCRRSPSFSSIRRWLNCQHNRCFMSFVIAGQVLCCFLFSTHSDLKYRESTLVVWSYYFTLFSQSLHLHIWSEKQRKSAVLAHFGAPIIIIKEPWFSLYVYSIIFPHPNPHSPVHRCIYLY